MLLNTGIKSALSGPEHQPILPIQPVNFLHLAWLSSLLGYDFNKPFAGETQKLSLQKAKQDGGNLTIAGKRKRDTRDDVRIPDLSTGKTRGNVGIWR